MQPSVLSADDLERLLGEAFPEAFHPDSGLAILDVRNRGSKVRMAFAPHRLRPGGTISGPNLMLLADVAMYVAVLASIGWQPLAVTTSLNINFLQKPPPGALIGECRLIKLGRRLAVGDVGIRAEAGEDLVAHATLTYSIPPNGNV